MMKKFFKNALLPMLVLSLLACFFLRGCRNKDKDTGDASSSAIQNEDTGNASEEAQESYLHITYKGKEYTYNSRILTVMIAGVDSDAELTTYNRYTIAPRADTVELLIFDDYNKTVSILALSRDTITSVARYTMNGTYRDHYDTQLGYSYTYGDGGKVSCENLMASVRALLKDVPIHEYVITNSSSVGELLDLVGGLSVTVPNDDLASVFPEFTAGAMVELDAETAETFTRWRDTSAEFSNNGRMERQKAFSEALMIRLIDQVRKDPEGTWSRIESLSGIYQTSVTENQYLDLADRLDTETFSENQYYILSGENVYDEELGVDQFYVDEENLMETILKLFYLEDR